jgi:hypothetical protein
MEQEELHVSNSFYSADRTAHFKIVVAALIAGIAVVSVAISVRLRSDHGNTRSARVIKAGEFVKIASLSGLSVR